jgi:hypothetical protein
MTAAMFLKHSASQGAFAGEDADLRTIGDAVRTMPRVSEAAATWASDDAGRKLAIAWIVPQRPDAPSADDLLDELDRILSNQVPLDAIVLLNALPRTQDGTLDRARLPRPEWLFAARRYPRTLREELLCSLFATVLDLPDIGVTDNFFECGGHSLLATRLVNRIQSTLRCEVGVRDLFEAPSVAELAARIGHMAPRPPVIDANAATGVVVGALAMLVPLCAALDHRALTLALSDLALRHAALRGPGGEVVPPVAVHTMDRFDPALALRFGRERGSNLPGAWPWQATLFSTPEGTHALRIDADAARLDVHSLDVLRRDLSQAYAARAAGIEPVWELTADLPPRFISARPPIRAPRVWEFAMRSFDMPTGLHASLRSAARAWGTSFSLLVQTLVALVVARLSAQRSATVLRLSAGRDGGEVDDAVGAFDDPVALQIDANDLPSVETALIRVTRDALAGAGGGLASGARVLPLVRVSLESRDRDAAASKAWVDLGALGVDLFVDLAERLDADGEPAGVSGAIAYDRLRTGDIWTYAFAHGLIELAIRVASEKGKPVAGTAHRFSDVPGDA